MPVIQGQVTGPDAAALLASCQAGYGQASQAAHITGGQPLGNAYVTEQAFRWAAYTPADATVDLVSAGPGSGGVTIRASTRVEVVWQGGDWRVVAPPGGDWATPRPACPPSPGTRSSPAREGERGCRALS